LCQLAGGVSQMAQCGSCRRSLIRKAVCRVADRLRKMAVSDSPDPLGICLWEVLGVQRRKYWYDLLNGCPTASQRGNQRRLDGELLINGNASGVGRHHHHRLLDRVVIPQRCMESSNIKAQMVEISNLFWPLMPARVT
jgi:hypothetical protein